MKALGVFLAWILAVNSVSAAVGEDATALIAELEKELCAFPTDQVTQKPRSLAAELLDVEDPASLKAYDFGDELWLGVAGQDVRERFVILQKRGGNYRVTDCLPFRAMGSGKIEIDGAEADSFTFGLSGVTPRGYDLFTAEYRKESGSRELHSATRVDPFYYEKDIRTWDDPVADPWHWAEIRFGVDLGGTREHIWGFEKDFDADGVDELVITSMASHGNAGGSFAFFKRHADSYRFIGYAWLQTLQVLPPSADGSIRLRSFARYDVNCGIAMTMDNDGSQFHEIDSVKSCDDNERYAALVREAEIVSPGKNRFRPEAWSSEASE